MFAILADDNDAAARRYHDGGTWIMPQPFSNARQRRTIRPVAGKGAAA